MYRGQAKIRRTRLCAVEGRVLVQQHAEDRRDAAQELACSHMQNISSYIRAHMHTHTHIASSLKARNTAGTASRISTQSLSSSSAPGWNFNTGAPREALVACCCVAWNASSSSVRGWSSLRPEARSRSGGSCGHEHTHTHTCTQREAHTHTSAHTGTYIRAHKHTHTHTHTSVVDQNRPHNTSARNYTNVHSHVARTHTYTARALNGHHTPLYISMQSDTLRHLNTHRGTWSNAPSSTSRGSPQGPSAPLYLTCNTAVRASA